MLNWETGLRSLTLAGALLGGVLATALPSGAAQAGQVAQDNLVSDGFIPAQVTDPRLVNAWGISYGPGGPFWVSDNGTGLTTLYNGAGARQGLVVRIPGPTAGTTSSPTGQAFNPTSDFVVSADGHSGAAAFLFATEDGTISGWNPNVANGATSELAVDNSKTVNGFGTGEVYKGLAIAQVHGDSFLFASDFRDGRVEVYNSQFQPVKSFTDPNVPTDYAPFNVQVLGHHLFVTFAVRNSSGHDDVAGLGNGFVDEFNFNGTMVARVASHGVLDSPWGLAMAPKGFGKFAGDLLVGNFGNGEIHAFNLHTDKLVGTLHDAAGHPIQIDGLWSLIPGNSGPGGHPSSLYFTAGVGGENHGLFGRLVFHHDLHM